MNVDEAKIIKEKLEAFSAVLSKYSDQASQFESAKEEVTTLVSNINSLTESIKELVDASDDYVTEISKFLNSGFNEKLDGICLKIESLVQEEINSSKKNTDQLLEMNKSLNEAVIQNKEFLEKEVKSDISALSESTIYGFNKVSEAQKVTDEKIDKKASALEDVVSIKAKEIDDTIQSKIDKRIDELIEKINANNAVQDKKMKILMSLVGLALAASIVSIIVQFIK